jgi:hypothetical protein
MGLLPGLKGFSAAILGGLGAIAGAILGGAAAELREDPEVQREFLPRLAHKLAQGIGVSPRVKLGEPGP